MTYSRSVFSPDGTLISASAAPHCVSLSWYRRGLYIGRKHGALHYEGFLETGKFGVGGRGGGGSEILHLTPTRYTVTTRMSHLNVSLTVWAKSLGSVHKPQILKRKESRSGSNPGPSSYQPSALPLGQSGSQLHMCVV